MGKTEIGLSMSTLQEILVLNRKKYIIEELEGDIQSVEDRILGGNERISQALESERKALSSFLHENAKGVLIKSRISSIKDIDASTYFFFHLEKKARAHLKPLKVS